jgi:hypothetical protein
MIFSKSKNLKHEQDFSDIGIGDKLRKELKSDIFNNHISRYLTLSDSEIRSPFSILGNFEEDFVNGNVSKLVKDNKEGAFLMAAGSMFSIINEINETDVSRLFDIRMMLTVNHLSNKYGVNRDVEKLKREDVRALFLEMFTVKGIYEHRKEKRLLDADVMDLFRELSAIGINTVFYWKVYFEKEKKPMDLLMAIVISCFGEFLVEKPLENKTLFDAEEILGNNTKGLKKDVILTFFSIVSEIKRTIPDIENIVDTAKQVLKNTIHDHDEKDKGPKDEDFE